MRAVLGLGNPGEEYRRTRHNAGFRVLAALAARHGGEISRKRFHALVGEVQLGSAKVILACPQTFMNESGRAARALSDFFGLSPAELLVVCDDFHLPLGQLRARPAGSDGGHNGLESVIRELGTQDFPRLRVGIGECRGDSVQFVLGAFSRAEERAMVTTLDRAADAVEVWAGQGLAECMNRYNAAEKKESEGAS